MNKEGTGFKWLILDFNNGFHEHCNDPWDSIEGSNFLII